MRVILYVFLKKNLGITPAMYKQLYLEKTQLEYNNQYNQQ